jgi:hypothetical protein
LCFPAPLSLAPPCITLCLLISEQELHKLEWTGRVVVKRKPATTATTTTTDNSGPPGGGEGNDSENLTSSAATTTNLTPRFDFNGHLLLPSQTPTTTGGGCEQSSEERMRGLFHHGKEPDRPGYTISELIYLSHSSVSSQRCVGLKILRNVLDAM